MLSRYISTGSHSKAAQSSHYKTLPGNRISRKVPQRLNMFCLRVALLASAICLVVAENSQLYNDKYDHIDAADILGNERLREQYLKCFLKTGPCITADAKFFKDIIPEALVTKCKRCTDRQRSNVEKITLWYIENDPDKWNELLKEAIERTKKA